MVEDLNEKWNREDTELLQKYQDMKAMITAQAERIAALEAALELATGWADRAKVELDERAKRIMVLEMAVGTAWNATQSAEMAYEDIALAVETTLGAVMDWTDHEDHLPADY
jgi:chaperonin cofactor prefoldin